MLMKKLKNNLTKNEILQCIINQDFTIQKRVNKFFNKQIILLNGIK